MFHTGATNPRDFEGTIRKGVEMGATSIELWPNPKLKHWAAMIEANKTPLTEQRNVMATLEGFEPSIFTLKG